MEDIFSRVLRMINDASESEGGEYIWHRDGSVTDNRWKAKAVKPRPSKE